MGDVLREWRVMSPHGASFLGTKRPREEHENADHHQQQAVEYPSSANNVVAEEEPNSPGFKQGARRV